MLHMLSGLWVKTINRNSNDGQINDVGFFFSRTRIAWSPGLSLDECFYGDEAIAMVIKRTPTMVQSYIIDKNLFPTSLELSK